MFLPYQISKEEIHKLQHYDVLSTPSLLIETKDAYNILESKAKLSENEIDGDELKNGWLPVDKHYDVFISYSHNDRTEALKLVSWLVSKGVSCFIDSVYWENCDKLLKVIDEKWCKRDDGLFDYNKRNYTTSLVHAMLSMAMYEAIDHCDFAFFVKSDSTIAFDYCNMNLKTSSPWIYEEVNYMTSIEKRLPQCLRFTSTMMSYREGGILLEQKDNGVPVKMFFGIPAETMIKVDSNTLNTIDGSGDVFLLNLCKKYIEV